jgi:acetylornithine deacetylase/succinyl-diaminopimelate desuccinylase-like protein
MIAGLRKPNGALNVPGLYAKVARPSAKQLARYPEAAAVGAKFRRTPACPGVRLWGERQFSLLERMWTRPALTVIALEARPFLGSSNQIIEAARARLSLRTVPGMDAREAGRLIVKKLTTRPPYGVKVTATIKGTTPWWITDPEGPAFEAARSALKAGFGKETAMVGAGGTIGFVQPFADLLKGAPCILMGVADPNTQAHSENESLHLGDWVKAMRSTIHLYDALARLPRR